MCDREGKPRYWVAGAVNNLFYLQQYIVFLWWGLVMCRPTCAQYMMIELYVYSGVCVCVCVCVVR